jgi:hypothetical protein
MLEVEFELSTKPRVDLVETACMVETLEGAWCMAHLPTVDWSG